MRAAASGLDLIHGGYFRARPASILFYAGPDNAPAGWPYGFPDGAPEAARARVGEAEVVGPEGPNELTVRLTVSNWAALRAVNAADPGDHPGSYRERVMAQEAAFRGRTEDRAWLREQFRKLRAHAAGKLVEG